MNEPMNPEALDIVHRLVKYTLYKSMNQLRKRIKSELTTKGFKEELKKFKIKNGSAGVVQVYFKTTPARN
jgi:hypothetical protein